MYLAFSLLFFVFLVLVNTSVVKRSTVDVLGADDFIIFKKTQGVKTMDCSDSMFDVDLG